MKKISLLLLSILLMFSLASCRSKCEHAYDHACDASCNVCGKIREVGAHDYLAADCDTAKTCKNCGATDGEALGHTAEADDGNCTTDIKCTDCGKTAVAGASDHKDNNRDYICDNSGCQVTLPGAPKDENEGIDLPLVPNN